MNLEQFIEVFEKDIDVGFGDVGNKLSSRKDIHALILLNQIAPSDKDMVAAAEHDQIYLGVDVEDLLPIITEEQIVELMRCGVFYDEDTESLCMFV